jgi:GT2 family glycosyltransferase
MKIGIVILNWNGLKLLQQFLPSVVKHSTDHTVYIADNASTDASITWVKDHFPNVQIISMDKNLGYAGGYNEAIPAVKEEILCLLNNDVGVSAGWCEPVTTAFANDRSLAACQPKILSYKNTEQFEYAGACGGFLDSLAYPYCRGRIFDHCEMDYGQYDHSVEIDWASGAALFVRKKAFLDAGGFDPSYFAHQEEIDLCWRLRGRGYRIRVVPSSVVYHLGGATLAAQHPDKTYLNFRNSLFNIIKNDHGSWWWFKILVRLILDGIAAIRFLITGQARHFIAVIKAHISMYPQLPQFLKKRTKSKKNLTLQSKHKGVRSIVFQYFIAGNKRFLN